MHEVCDRLSVELACHSLETIQQLSQLNIKTHAPHFRQRCRHRVKKAHRRLLAFEVAGRAGRRSWRHHPFLPHQAACGFASLRSTEMLLVKLYSCWSKRRDREDEKNEDYSGRMNERRFCEDDLELEPHAPSRRNLE